MHAIQRQSATLRTVKQRCFAGGVCAARLHADKSSCGVCGIPRNTPERHANMSIRAQRNIATTCRAIESRIIAKKSTKAHSCHFKRLQTTTTLHKEPCIIRYAYRQNQYCDDVTFLFHTDHTYLRTQKQYIQYDNHVFVNRRQVQLQARAAATLEDMFNAST